MHDDVLPVLERLVALDTTSRNSNLPLVEWVADRLAAVAGDVRLLPEATGTKANLLVRLGPEAPGGVVLSGHTDCVPVDGQDWATDPFTLTRVGDRVHGRGTADMKGFLACCIALAPTLAAGATDTPVWFAFTHDEEVGTLGAPAAVAGLLAAGATPEAVVIGEPTLLRPVIAHKGIRAYRVTVTGQESHSSQPQRAANAVVAASRIAAFVDDLAARKAEESHPPFEPPYTTFNVARIDGGTAINIVPNRCTLTFEYRPVPADDGPELFDEVRAFAEGEVLPRLRRHADGDIAFEEIATTPTLAAEEDGAAERLVRAVTGVSAPAEVVAYGTDGSHFQAAGLSTVVFGPGSIDVAHRPDEYVALAQLDGCEQFLRGLAHRDG